VVKTYRDLPSGKSVVNSFLFSRDLFGLARNGHYVNCAKTVTRATLYRLATDELAALLKIDGELQFKFLARLTHEIRASQRRALLVSRRDAAGRLAMFLTWMTEHLEKPVAELRVIPLPMLRTDIAGFLGLSLESVSRASAELQERGLVKFESQHLVRILDGAKLARLAASV
jgi:CRP-like cAMP-binding protein